MEKLYFSLYNYTLLSLIIISAYGLGSILTHRAFERHLLQKVITVPFNITIGLAVAILVLFLAGVFEKLNSGIVLLLLIFGIGVTIWQFFSSDRSSELSKNKSLTFVLNIKQNWYGAAVVFLSLFYLFLKPLSPPSDWDDVMYHLPYARYWAENSSLAINEWLRYPLFPYNMNLLYAAALVFEHDVLPKLIHALTTALSVILTYAFARNYISKSIAIVASLALVVTTTWGWGNAMVDMGIMLFWTAAFISLALRSSYQDKTFSYLAALLAGIAVGVKYQGLFYLPAFIIIAFLLERSIRARLISIAIFLVTGSYWYLRNYFISGDPIYPIGGNIFGFWLWNEQDIVNQFADFNHRKELPPLFLCLSIGALIYWRTAENLIKGMIIAAVISTLIWAFASQYPRYLTPMYPFLAILAAYTLGRIGVIAWVVSTIQKPKLWIRQTAMVFLIILASVSGYKNMNKYWEKISANSISLSQYLSDRYPGYSLLQESNFDRSKTLYQLGFEDEIYYLNKNIRGDVFGAGRYEDIRTKVHSSPLLVAHLKGLGADSLLVNIGRSGFVDWNWDPQMLQYFRITAQSENAILYVVK